MTYGLSIWSDELIDPNSHEIKVKVSKAIADYVLNNWENIVCIENIEDTEGHEILFKVTL